MWATGFNNYGNYMTNNFYGSTPSYGMGGFVQNNVNINNIYYGGYQQTMPMQMSYPMQTMAMPMMQQMPMTMPMSMGMPMMQQMPMTMPMSYPMQTAMPMMQAMPMQSYMPQMTMPMPYGLGGLGYGGYPSLGYNTSPLGLNSLLGGGFPSFGLNSLPLGFDSLLGGGFPSITDSILGSGYPSLGYNDLFGGGNLIDQLLSSLLFDDQILGGGIDDLFSELINIDDEILGAWGDPHFDFKDKSGEKVRIDHKGTTGDTYNILNADGLDIDAEYKKWSGGTEKNPQVMGAVRVQAKDQELLLHEGKVTLSGKDGKVEELKAGTTKKLNDGRTIKVLEGGNVEIGTKDGKGKIDLKYRAEDKYYDIDPSKEIGVNSKTDNGGILGFLLTKGQDMTKDEIMKKYDTNKNEILDDGDKELAKFKAKEDIGLYERENKDVIDPLDILRTRIFQNI